MVQISVTDDSSDEPREEFSLQLSDATGGAIVGPRAAATVFVADNDAAPPSPPPPSSGGGGGPAGFVSQLLLCFAYLLRAGRMRALQRIRPIRRK